jgi:NitT/TauT family transport system ATP-binding protein
VTEVRLDRVSIGYRGRPVLAELSLTVGDQEILVLLGSSGCGKSTLLRTIAGLQPTLAGRLTVDGVPVHGPSGRCTLVFQDDALLPWRSVRRNVELPLAVRGVPRRRRRALAESWIERVGLADYADRLPGELSGGMRQRAQLARTLAGGATLLLMDEPFGALDATTRAAMQRLLVEVWRSQPATIVFVTHDVAEAMALGDRIAVLSPTGLTDLVDVPAPRTPTQPEPTHRELSDRLLAALGSAISKGTEGADSDRDPAA